MKTGHLNQYQMAWIVAMAKVQTDRERQRKAECNPLEYEKYGRLYLSALEDLKIATAKLLTFAKERVARDMANRPELNDVLKLFDDDVLNYCHTEVLPNWWQSKLIESTLRTNFNK